jgi:hypothetical protein
MTRSLYCSSLSVVAILLSVVSVSFAAPVLPDFAAATFVPGAPINNPFFPLAPGTVYTYVGQRTQDSTVSTELNTVTVTSQTKDILGAPARVVVDEVRVDGVLTEHTLDYFAQDTAGNVWYMGEATTEFLFDDNGNPTGTSTAGSFQAGVNGAQPGFIMEAAPAVGDQYFQEFSPGVAEDQAQVISLDADVSVAFGHFTNALQTLESTALEPGAFEYKFYAQGVGTVLTQELDENLQPTFVSELISVQVVPEPMSLSLAALGVTGVAWIRRRLARSPGV